MKRDMFREHNHFPYIYGSERLNHSSKNTYEIHHYLKILDFVYFSKVSVIRAQKILWSLSINVTASLSLSITAFVKTQRSTAIIP